MTRYFPTSRAVLTALLAGALLAGCGDDDGDDNNPRDSGPSASDSGAGDAGRDGGLDASANLDASTDASSQADAGRLSDNQIVGVTNAVNNAEISAGMLAAQKGTTQSVKAFATLMVSDHQAANARQTALGITAAPSTLRQGLEATAMSVMASLTNASMGLVFDRLYIQSQVDMHTMTLQTIDNELLTDVMSTALRNDLTLVRASVAMHLTRAQEILTSLGDAGVPDASVSSVPLDGGLDGG